MALALAGAGGALGSSAARAETSVDGAAADASVEELVQRGIELRRSGQDEQALGVFREALDRAPDSVRVKVHLASTHQALGQWVEAERYLGQALAAADEPYIRRHRSTLEKAYAFVDQRIGSLDVVGGPDGAELLLSGRPIGQLPLLEPLRVPIGSYLLEVRKPGYYTVSRPISIGGGALLRESIVLGQRPEPAFSWSAPSPSEPVGAEPGSGSPRWLTWTLAGAGASALAVSAIAFGVREKHAARWNSDDCIEPGSTRGQVCPEELSDGRTAERWGIGAAIASGVLVGGALVSYAFESDERRPGSARVEACGVGWGGAGCFGSF